MIALAHDVVSELRPPHIRRIGERYQLVDDMWLPQPRSALFEFFAQARNLEAITPDFLEFKIITPEPIVMEVGTIIDYRLRVRGLPMRWRTAITAWEPPFRFIDEQLRGPYQLWRHEHTFEELDGGTLIRDRIDFRAKGGPLAPLLHRVFVNRDVSDIFTYRKVVLARRFAASFNSSC